MVFAQQDIYKNAFGIYKIVNAQTGLVYVGQTGQSFERRFWLHQWKLKRGVHDNIHLQRAWDKYGEDSFQFVVVQVCENKEQLDEKQIKYIEAYDSYRNGYNMTSGGGGKRGCPMSDSAKQIVGQKNRAHMTGRKASMQTRQKMSKSSKHTPCSEQHKEIVRQYMRNRTVSDQTKKKIADAFRGSKSSFAKINDSIAADIKRRLMDGQTPRSISSELGVGYQTVTAIRSGKTWKYVEVPGWSEWCLEYNA